MKDLISEVLARVFPNLSSTIAIPTRHYRGSPVAWRPVRGAFRLTRALEHFDSVDAFEFNLALVTDNSPPGTENLVEQRWPASPVVQIAAEDVPSLIRSIAEGPLPVYLAWVSGTKGRETRVVTSLARDIVFKPGDTFTLFTPHLDRTTGRTYAEEHGCMVEVVSPPAVETSLQGVVIPAIRVDPFEVDFPVDVVYLWVDDTDPSWVEAREERLSQSGTTRLDRTLRPALYQSHDELRYSLRSLDRFAPWVDKVYLVTAGQRPSWLLDHPRLKIVDHRDILPAGALPTFNSHAIVAGLHHIDGLAEHFVVMNDDVFFGRPLAANRLFLSNGMARFFLSTTELPVKPRTDHDLARNGTADLVKEITGSRPINVFKHTPVAFRRSLLESLESELPEEFEQTVNSPFRSGDDIVVEYLHHYVGYQRRLALPGTIQYGYFAFGTDRGMAALERYARSQASEVFCVNDLSNDKTDLTKARSTLQSILSDQFPNRAPWEG